MTVTGTVSAPSAPATSMVVTELTGAERDAIWQRYLEFEVFQGYTEKSGGRVFPIFRFSRIG